ncbi:hypothetical protein LTR41_011429 [Exophiala xenobiotica]|nr:hypothetical protein LTR41_011429 [Exophiala xenobiotica]
MQIKKYIPDFLLPTDEPAAPPRIYDVPLRRGLFHKAQPGNEHTISASRNNSVVSEEQRKRNSHHQSEATENVLTIVPWTKFFVDLGVIDNSTQTQTQTRDLRTRMFGSREDPATGSAASALASYLALQTGRAGRYKYRLTQGVEMGQNSQIAVEVSVKLATASTATVLGGINDKVEVEEVLLSGSAVLTMRGTLDIPDDED